MLTAQGYLASTVEDGPQARDKIARALPALVILDLTPKMSGFQLLSEWRSALRTAEMPVFVLTNKDLNAEEESLPVSARGITRQKTGVLEGYASPSNSPRDGAGTAARTARSRGIVLTVRAGFSGGACMNARTRA